MTFSFGEKRNRAANGDYATAGDFCRIFKQEQSSLYLLAFLLTANHQHAEQCLVAGIEDSGTENVVFREWARAWTKRTLIKNALQRVFFVNDGANQKRERWNEIGSEDRDLIDAVAGLPLRERFVFVMSVLERYSDRDCSLLLDCKLEDVRQAREQALQQLPAFLPRAFTRRSANLRSRLAASG